MRVPAFRHDVTHYHRSASVRQGAAQSCPGIGQILKSVYDEERRSAGGVLRNSNNNSRLKGGNGTASRAIRLPL